MRIRARHLVLLLAPLVLAACGGESGTTGGAGNLPPIIQGSPTTTIAAGTPYSFTPSAADPDGDAMTFSITNKPTWATFSTSTGALTGTPSQSDVGVSGMITIEVSDSKAVSQLAGFKIQVASSATVPPGTNNPPTISGSPATTATVGQVYTFMPVGSDPDNDTLSYTIDNKPGWATFTASTGQLTGTPTTADVGTTNNIVIHVSDGTASAALPAFNLQVSSTAPANRAPTISGTPATTATVGTAYSFRPVGSDPDGNTLTYTIQGLPSWATFSTTTGRLSGTPTSADVGTSPRITITVSDGSLTASLAGFNIVVSAAANRIPTITGTPATSITVGSAYSFQPVASDPDSNPLTFGIENKPAWATFNTSSGQLTGSPTAADVGTYSAIRIYVSDGTAQASLSTFSITVAALSTGSATLTWDAPTTNTDGSALTDLAGYRLAYGKSQSTLDQSAQIADPNVTTYTVSNLSSGTWYFALYAYSSSGAESTISNVASKSIP